MFGVGARCGWRLTICMYNPWGVGCRARCGWHRTLCMYNPWGVGCRGQVRLASHPGTGGERAAALTRAPLAPSDAAALTEALQRRHRATARRTLYQVRRNSFKA